MSVKSDWEQLGIWGRGFVVLFLLSVVAVLVVIALKYPGTSGERASVGDEARLVASGTQIPVAVDEESFSRYMDAVMAKDTYGLQELIAADRLFYVRYNTKVLVIDMGFFKDKVRILEGPYAGRSGWVPDEWVEKEGYLASSFRSYPQPCEVDEKTVEWYRGLHPYLKESEAKEVLCAGKEGGISAEADLLMKFQEQKGLRPPLAEKRRRIEQWEKEGKSTDDIWKLLGEYERPYSERLKAYRSSPRSNRETGYADCGISLTHVPVLDSLESLIVVERLNCCEKVTILARGDGWLKVRTNENKDGYVSKLFVSETKNPRCNVRD